MPALGNIDELLATVGASAFRTLVEVRGGTTLRVPRYLPAAAHIIQWIGLDAAAALVREYGGFVIEVPNLKATPALDHRVQPLLGQMTDTQIALAVGCTERTVRNIRRRNGTETGRLPARNVVGQS